MAIRINTHTIELVKTSGKTYNIDNIVKSPEIAAQAVETVCELSKQTREHFGIIALNTKNKIISIDVLHIGTLNSCIVHPRDVFQRALLHNSGAVILFHNHPSGDTAPSDEDVKLTKRMVEAGKMLGIEVFDHIITGDPDAPYPFLSMKETHYML